MEKDIEIEELRLARKVLEKHFKQTDPRLVRLSDEPFLNYEIYDMAGRLLEFRTDFRGVIVEIRQDMFDAFFSNVGPTDQVRLLTIGAPLPIESNLTKISTVCLAWVIEGQSEQATLKLIS